LKRVSPHTPLQKLLGFQYSIAPALRQIMKDNRWNTHWGMTTVKLWTSALPALRMGLPEAFSHARAIILNIRFPAGHASTSWGQCPDSWRAPEDNYLGVTATTEMLLQSQGEAMRLFPCWPREMPAAFRGLPARGGFIVTAQWDPAKSLTAKIDSLAGEQCRVRWPGELSVTCDGKNIATRREGRDVIFPTRRGASFVLSGE